MATYKVSLRAASKVAFVSSPIEPTPNGSIMLGLVNLDGPNPKYDPINMGVLYDLVRQMVAKQAGRPPYLPKIVLLEAPHDSEKTAYELAAKAGFNGTLEDWLLSLQGANGNDGNDGVYGDVDIDNRAYAAEGDDADLEETEKVQTDT